MESCMNNLADTVFPFLFGWFRMAVQSMYTALTHPSAQTFFTWVGDNWKILLAVVLLSGTLIDLLVYLFRWRPLAVWASFFRRMAGKGKYDSIREMEILRTVGAVPEDDAYEIPDQELAQGLKSLTYQDPQTDIEYISHLAQSEDTQQTTLYARKRRSPEKMKKSRIRHLIRLILADTEDEEKTNYKLAHKPPARDARDVFSAPYIPPQWKQPEEVIHRRKRSNREEE